MDEGTIEEAHKPLCLKDKIHPVHLLQAIENSFKHSHETAHGVTGIAFERYTITVRKRSGLCWSVECRLKARDTDNTPQVRDDDTDHITDHGSRDHPEEGVKVPDNTLE